MKRIFLLCFLLAFTLVDCSCEQRDNHVYAGCSSDPDIGKAVWRVMGTSSWGSKEFGDPIGVDLKVARENKLDPKKYSNAGIVRLMGINCIDSQLDSDPAKKWLKENVVGKLVRLEREPDIEDSRKYSVYWNRYVWLGDQLINTKLISLGFARYDTRRIINDLAPGLFTGSSGGHRSVLPYGFERYKYHDEFVTASSVVFKNFVGSEKTSTATTETLVSKYDPSHRSLYFNGVKGLGNSMLFGQWGQQLWITNGTANGTFKVKNLSDSESSSSIGFGRVRKVGPSILFDTDVDGREDIWLTDGTPSGTTRVSTGFRQGHSVRQKGDLWFAMLDSQASKYRIWRSDGTESGTMNIAEFGAKPDNLEGNLLIKHKGQLYLSTGASLSVLDEAGELVDVKSFEGRKVHNLRSTASLILFSVDDDELWQSDGTDEGTVPVVFKQATDENENPINSKEDTDEDNQIDRAPIEDAAGDHSKKPQQVEYSIVDSYWFGHQLVATHKDTKETRVIHTFHPHNALIAENFVPTIIGRLGNKIIVSTTIGAYFDERILISISIEDQE